VVEQHAARGKHQQRTPDGRHHDDASGRLWGHFRQARRAERDHYLKVLQSMARQDCEVRFCVRCGSHVYGTSRPDSDKDLLLVLADDHARQDLIWGENLNVVVHGGDSYRQALAAQSVFALEALFAPAHHRLKEAIPPFDWTLDLGRLFESAKARSDADWSKAKKKFDEDVAGSKKRAMHALRVVAFAHQIVDRGAITDFGVAVPWWEELFTGPYDSADALEDAFGPIRQAMLAELRSRAGL
jgi:hypothetical protein